MRMTGLAALGAVLALAACAGTRSDATDDALLAAGFTRSSAPDWQALMKTMPRHKFLHRDVNGVRTYYWSDPVACRCVYQGSAQAFAAYQAHPATRTLLAGEEALQTSAWAPSMGDRAN